MRTFLTVVAIISGVLFAAAITYFVDGVLHNLSSGWSPLERRSLGVFLGLLLQTGLFMAPFQRTPSTVKRVVLFAMMLPCLGVFTTIVKSADVSQQEQLLLMIPAAFGLVVYGVAIVYVWTRPYENDGHRP